MVLIAEADQFSLDDTDISDITSSEMEIKLSDQALVQLNYHSALRTLYTELKAHIQNVFNKGWIFLKLLPIDQQSPLSEKTMVLFDCAVTTAS